MTESSGRPAGISLGCFCEKEPPPGERDDQLVTLTAGTAGGKDEDRHCRLDFGRSIAAATIFVDAENVDGQRRFDTGRVRGRDVAGAELSGQPTKTARRACRARSARLDGCDV